jgi:putative hydrolase of the HAD superfamily
MGRARAKEGVVTPGSRGAVLPAAVLLDLDDTILDDSGNVSQCWREACLAHAADLGAADPAVLHETIERTRAWFWSDPERHRVGRLDLDAARREIVSASLAELHVETPGAVEKIAEHYRAQRHRGIQPLEDAIETVRWLRESGCRLALLTNGAADAQRSKVARFELAGLFDLILIEGELGYGKPDPRVYRIALDELEARPAETWMVGDHLEWDVAAPQRLGIYGIWVDRGGAGVPPGNGVRPDRVIRSLSELRHARGHVAAHRATPPSTPA